MFLFLLTLLFSLSGPALGGYSDFGQSSNAARGIPPLRQQYVDEVVGLKDLGLSARAAGADGNYLHANH
jgi:hypothetical protein